MALGETITNLMMGIGIDVDSASFKEFENEVNEVFGGVKEKAKSVTSGIGQGFKNAMPAVGKAVKTAAIGAAAGFTAIAGAAGVASKEIFDMASETAAAGDRIDKMSLSLGLSRQGFQEWDYILGQNGASIDSMKTSMTKLNNLIDDASNGSQKAADSFSKIGISLSDLEGKSREEVFSMTIKGLQGIEDESTRAALANDLLGKASVDLAALLAAGAEGTEELRQRAHELGLVMSDEAVDASVKFGDTIDDLKKTVAGFKNRIADDFLPGITMVADGLIGLLSGDFKGGADKIAEGLDSIITEATEGLTSAVQVLGELLPTLLPILADAAINLMQSILDTITSNIDPLVSTVVDVLTMLANFIIENLPTVIGAGIEILVALALGIANAIPDLIPVVIEAIGTIITTLIDNLPLLIEAAFQIIEALAFGLIDALPTLIEQLPKLITSITTFIAENLPEIVGMGIKIIIALAGGIIQAIPQLLKEMPQLLSAIVSSIGGVVASVIRIGKNIVEGLWEGIKSMGGWIKDKVTGFFSGITDGVKGLLGIHSPSRVYAGIGSDMGAGIGVGFDDTMNTVAKEMEKRIPTDFDIDTNITETSKRSVITAYTGTAEDSVVEVKRQQEREARQGKAKSGDIYLTIKNAFGDKQGMRRYAEELKAVFEELGMENGDIVTA